MKAVILFIALNIMSGTLCASESSKSIIKGEEAEALFNELRAYEYSSAAITSVLEYRLTVRHDNVISCEKEETKYINSAKFEVQYTCTK